MKTYYLDTAIWIDLYENRKGYKKEPLGDFAWKLFALIKLKKDQIIVSDLVITELEAKYSVEQIRGMIKPFEDIIIKVFLLENQNNEAKILTKKRDLPRGDVIHAIIARDTEAILITRDKHFKELDDISKHYKPEDII